MAGTITMSMKRALVVGCNYPGTLAELHGCVNDAWQVHGLLVSTYGFDADRVEVLVDDHVGGRDAPTGANIRRTLARMASSSRPGDLLFFHFSGHGTRLPPHAHHHDDDDDDDDDDGGQHDDRDGDYDECIVPCDMNLLTDEDFREIVNLLPSGVAFTIVADSCHSGGLVRYEKEQIGDSFFHGLNPNGKREAHSRNLRYSLPTLIEEEESSDIRCRTQENQQDYNGYEGKKRYLPLSTLLEILKQKSGNDVKLGKIRATLYSLFMDDASSKVKILHNLLMPQMTKHKVQESSNRLSEDDQLQFIQKPKHLVIDNIEPKCFASQNNSCKTNLAQELKKTGSFFTRSTNEKGESDMAILLSACQAYESAQDALPPDGNPKEAFGVMTHALCSILTHQCKDENITNYDLILSVRKLLEKQGFSQHPGLYCSDNNTSEFFLSFPRKG